VTDGTNAIKAAISATAPAELQWLPNPGHEPEIPEGWEIAGARFSDGDEYTVPPNGRIMSLADANVTEYAIRRKPTQFSEPQGVRAQPTLDQALEQLRIEAECLQQPSPTPTLSEVTPVTEDAHELRKRAVLLALNGNWTRAHTIADRIGEPAFHVLIALRALCASGDVAQSVDDDGLPVFRLNTNAPMVNIFEPEPIRKQSAALVISGRLTAVGETFAGITSGGETMTLSIDADRARWLGQHVGRDVKLTVEVSL
jgi:hypothetical protein